MIRRGMRGGGSRSGRLIIALVIVVISLVSYFGSTQFNEITQEEQHVDMTVDQEIALGLQAAPAMAEQFGGLSNNQEWTNQVKEIGQSIVNETAAGSSEYEFDFHLLGDSETINAFALPGGQIFITEGLMKNLQTEGQLAGVLAHEVGHVVARHSAEHMAKARLTEGLTGAAVIASYDPNNPGSIGTAQLAQLIGSMVNMKFGRDDELESDRLGVRFLAETGYDPRSMIGVMQVLAEAGGPNRQPEFFSTHPNPDTRIENIEQAIAAEFPNGVPDGLQE